MTYILKNNLIELHIDNPIEGYQFSRFDWTGKITKLKYKGISIANQESEHQFDKESLGMGFYNEFGAKKTLGFEEAQIGGWFHKIGIGKLKKQDTKYKSNKTYEIIPAKFIVKTESNKIAIECISENINGFAYELEKEIELLQNGFCIQYELKNTGEKEIQTDEYTHNFIAINKHQINSDYLLKFPFELDQKVFDKIVNTESKVILNNHEVRFTDTPNEQFFFRNLTGNKKVTPKWTLIHQKHNISITERVNFETDKLDLWGWKHVISPEVFFKINLQPNKSVSWKREFLVFDLH